MFFRHCIQKLHSDLAFSIFVGVKLIFNSNPMLFIFMHVFLQYYVPKGGLGTIRTQYVK
jgi:hypothetical protein